VYKHFAIDLFGMTAHVAGAALVASIAGRFFRGRDHSTRSARD
jgi:hypothetical protein